MKAKLSTYHQAPRKTRLVTDMVKGKTVKAALETLTFLPKRAAEPVAKVIASAAANAGGDHANLIVKSITVDKGLVMKRFMIRARGGASPIRKRTSHINVKLDTKPASTSGK
jgi:large subunit ribosomal protein L22